MSSDTSACNFLSPLSWTGSSERAMCRLWKLTSPPNEEHFQGFSVRLTGLPVAESPSRSPAVMAGKEGVCAIPKGGGRYAQAIE